MLFADLTHKNMEEVGALEYTEEEKEFAGKIAELPGFISRIRMEED